MQGLLQDAELDSSLRGTFSLDVRVCERGYERGVTPLTGDLLPPTPSASAAKRGRLVCLLPLGSFSPSRGRTATRAALFAASRLRFLGNDVVIAVFPPFCYAEQRRTVTLSLQTGNSEGSCARPTTNGE